YLGIDSMRLIPAVRSRTPRNGTHNPRQGMIWLLVPGSLGLVSLTQLGAGTSVAGATVLESTGIIGSIALGLLIGTTAARAVGLLRRSRTRRPGARRRQTF
ncbi:MAG: hypothetical protein E6621_01170, partial [Cutibacterium avidum]|nr:hypothetical protein [Cutibacterium avidum]